MLPTNEPVFMYLLDEFTLLFASWAVLRSHSFKFWLQFLWCLLLLLSYFASREMQVAIIKLYNESVIITFNSWKRLEIWKRLKYLENNQTSLVQIRNRRTGDEIAQIRMRVLKTCSAPLAPAPHASGSWKHEQLKQLKIHAQIQYWRVRGLRKKAL